MERKRKKKRDLWMDDPLRERERERWRIQRWLSTKWTEKGRGFE